MIYIGSDHGGFLIKEYIVKYFNNKNLDFIDFGTNSQDSIDYPIIAKKVSIEISNNPQHLGILVCGTGIGMSIVANRFKNVRAALCWNKHIATLTKEHNNANILCLPGRFLSIIETEEILNAFFEAKFQLGRHEERIKNIENE